MTTDKKQWQRLNELLALALKQPSSKREAWVEEALGDEPELKAELLELLKYDAEETGGLASGSSNIDRPLLAKAVGRLVSGKWLLLVGRTFNITRLASIQSHVSRTAGLHSNADSRSK